jgi:hypothetical protein
MEVGNNASMAFNLDVPVQQQTLECTPSKEHYRGYDSMVRTASVRRNLN